jgi:hypothetical protein
MSEVGYTAPMRAVRNIKFFQEMSREDIPKRTWEDNIKIDPKK